jgi:hypothetical protein
LAPGFGALAFAVKGGWRCLPATAMSAAARCRRLSVKWGTAGQFRRNRVALLMLSGSA